MRVVTRRPGRKRAGLYVATAIAAAAAGCGGGLPDGATDGGASEGPAPAQQQERGTAADSPALGAGTPAPAVDALSPDEMRCFPAPSQETLAFDGKPLTYNCAAGDGSERVLIGSVIVAADGWHVEEAALYGSDEHIQVADTRLLEVTAVELADGSTCRFAGFVATKPPRTVPISFTCGDAKGAAVVLVGGLDETADPPTIARAVLPSGDLSGAGAGEAVPIAALIVRR